MSLGLGTPAHEGSSPDPPSTRREVVARLRAAAIALAVFVVGWLVFWSVDRTTERRIQLSQRLTLVERIRVERSAFSLAGGHGAFIALPIPSRNEIVTAQQVVRGAEVVWTGRRISDGWYEDVDVFPSGDERLLVLEARGVPHPIVIYDVPNRREIIVPEPAPVQARQHYGYEPEFLEWAGDSQAFFTFTDDLDLGDEFETWTRSVWKVNPQDGSSTLDRQCVDKFPTDPDKGPDWTRTACAGPKPARAPQ